MPPAGDLIFRIGACLGLFSITGLVSTLSARTELLLVRSSQYAPLTVLKAETETCMRLLGVERIDQLGMQHVSHDPTRIPPSDKNFPERTNIHIDQHAGGGEGHLRWGGRAGAPQPRVEDTRKVVKKGHQRRRSTGRFPMYSTAPISNLHAGFVLSNIRIRILLVFNM